MQVTDGAPDLRQRREMRKGGRAAGLGESGCEEGGQENAWAPTCCPREVQGDRGADRGQRPSPELGHTDPETQDLQRGALRWRQSRVWVRTVQTQTTHPSPETSNILDTRSHHNAA